MLQSLPLDVKIAKTKLRIIEAIDEFGVNGLYVPVSGGNDSMVLSEIVYDVQYELGIPSWKIPRVNSNTGNEYDGVLENARRQSDVEVKPSHNLIWVLSNEGYPVGSKKVSRMLRDLQNPTDTNFNSRRLYLEGIKQDGTKTKSFKMPNKWRKFIKSEIRCSEKCCYYLKKEPFHIYEKFTGRHPILGEMASEGGTRKASYLQTGCNAFKVGKSKPIGFWKTSDILMLIALHDYPYAKEYGDIIYQDTGIKVKYKDVRAAFNEGRSLKLTTSLEKRTGCVWCTYGVTQEKGENRFQRLARLDPRKYKFAITGGKFDEHGKLIPGNGGLGIGKLLDLMGVDYTPYNSNPQIEGQISIDDFI